MSFCDLSLLFSQHIIKPADLFWPCSLSSVFVSPALMRQCLPMAVLIQCHAFEYWKLQQLGLREAETRDLVCLFLGLCLCAFFFVLSTTSLTWFSHPETLRFQSCPWGSSVWQWLAPIPWSVPSQVMLVLLHGTMEFVCGFDAINSTENVRHQHFMR